MKHSRLLYIIIAVACMLIIQSILIMNSVKEMSGDARVVNYSGLVRGGTQRLVKLELTHVPNDALIGTIDQYLAGLSGASNSYGIVYMEDPAFQASISELKQLWIELCDAIYAYREGEISAEKLVELSELHFVKANEATAQAEYMSEGKLTETQFLLLICILCLSVIVVIVMILMVIWRRIERRQLAELEAARIRAEKANAAKTTFLSNMSHDIRTPLNGVIGMTAIASQNVGNPEKIADCLKQITSSSRYLLSLINGVLDMSKIESGHLKLNPSAFSMTAFMENLISVIQQQVSAKKQDLSVLTRDVVHEDLECDVLRLSQVFINILSNSVKFTPVGGKIGINVVEIPSGSEEYAHFQFTCFDNGMGMSKEFLETIFHSFTREEDSRIDKIEGTGLGMAISKGIVDMLGGEIKVQSEKGEGTIFTIDLDIKVGKPEHPYWDDTTLRGLRVLIVDDDADICESAVNEMQEIGILAKGLTAPQEAIEELQKARVPYDLVIVDWKMPEINGLELVKMIRAKINQSLPILLSSAYDWVELEPKAKEVGINGFINKPLFRSTLFGGIRNLFGQKNDAEYGPKHVNPNYNFSGVKALIAEDNELNMRIVVEILSTFGIRLDGAVDGQEVVDAFKRSAEFHYDVILMDVQMPVMNGYEATKSIRSLDRKDAKIVPIIAMTANAFDEDIKFALESGMNDHVAKPLDFELLKSVLNKHLSRAAQEAQSAGNGAASPQRVVKPEAEDMLTALKDCGADVSAGLARFINNRSLYEEIIFDFPQDPSFVRLTDSMAAKDYEKAELYAHTLKGLSANLSFLRLTEPLQQMLTCLRNKNYEGVLPPYEEAVKQYEILTKVINHWAKKSV